jgi:hypothetical protein
MKLHLTHWTFTNIIIANTFIVCFAGRDSIAQRRRALDLRECHDYLHHHRMFCRNGQPLLKGEAQAPLEVRPTFTGAEPMEGFEGRRRLQGIRGPQEGSNPTGDMCQLAIGRARK